MENSKSHQVTLICDTASCLLLFVFVFVLISIQGSKNFSN